MKLLSKLAVLLLGSGVALSSGSAMAQFVSNAQISQTGWRLIDLDVNDGITPSITFFDVATHSGAAFNGFNAAGYLSDFKNGSGNQPISTSVNYQQSHSASSFADGGLQSIAQLKHAGYVSTFQEFNAWFELTPHTRLEYFGNASARAKNDGTGHSDGNPSSAYSSTVLQVNLTANGQQGGGSGDSPAHHYFASTGIGAVMGENHLNENFSIRYENTNDQAFNGKLQLSTYVYGTAPAVPEPETYAMMLGGLALVAAYARRRRSK